LHRFSDLVRIFCWLRIYCFFSCAKMSQNKYSSVHKKDPELNILILAETGAGKSTTISALANYFMFESFEDATKKLDQLSVVCPVQFTLPDPVTGKMSTIKMGGDDLNERFENANSVTQAPIGYQFGIPGIVVQIIDKPGNFSFESLN